MDQDALVALATEMLCGASSAVKRAVLTDVLKLCLLLGRERTNNSLLPLHNSLLPLHNSLLPLHNSLLPLHNSLLR